MPPNRKITRLPYYDYRLNGAYYVTICTHQRRCVFGKMDGPTVRLHPFGQIAETCWLNIPNHFPGAELDEFVIMPNHVHGIILINGGLDHEPDETEPRPFIAPDPGSLSTIIGAYKSAVTRAIGAKRGTPTTVWQKRFFERIIRDEPELIRIREYIHLNPSHWQEDEHYQPSRQRDV